MIISTRQATGQTSSTSCHDSAHSTGQFWVFGSVSGLGQRQSTIQWFGQFSQRNSTLVNQSTVESTGQTQDAECFSCTLASSNSWDDTTESY
ncbi:hypothetical protein HanPSC8_Chr12g0532971 [Helianthus annuus]|nr:hypothetical protein HanPSC8_Chr12g0532971 [Helianthus annuus]